MFVCVFSLASGAVTSRFITLGKQGKNEHKLHRDGGACLSEKWNILKASKSAL